MNAAWRAQRILADPATEWAKIEGESGDAGYLLTGYTARLALIPAVFGFIGACIFGAVRPGAGTVRASIFNALSSVVFGYVMTCVTVLILGLLINLLAPMFDARRNFANALKLAIYSYTPVWLAGVFLLAPGLRFLGLIGFYGAYILWIGLPQLMKAPAPAAQSYTAAIVACACVCVLLAAAAQHALFGTVPF